ncbi:MAG: two-component regulator propeller domain-containing protein [Chitinispirillaceae bacterium]
MKRIFILLLLCVSISYSFERLINHCSPLAVNGFVITGDTLWAASSGGLVCRDLRNGDSRFYSSADMFPDPNLTSICKDSKGNIWMTSDRGYLYERTSEGRFSVHSNYNESGWRLTSIYPHEDLLVIGSNKGVSLFDPSKKTALKNAKGISDFSNPRINAITVFRDTLFLGGEQGVVFLDSLDTNPLRKRNFYYPGIWKIRDDSVSVVDFVNDGESVLAQSTPSVYFGSKLLISEDGSLNSGGELFENIAHSGNIISIYNEDDERLWIGTDQMYYFSYDGKSAPVQHRIEGMPLKRGTKIFTSSMGDVWVLPAVPPSGQTWYHGIARYDGNSWGMHDNSVYGSSFGGIGENDVYGIAEGEDGSVWVGTWGGNVKHIDPYEHSAGQLIVGEGDPSTIAYSETGDVSAPWGKVDAIARDSSGYLWMTVWESPGKGSVVCYDSRFEPVSNEPDPVKAHVRKFFPGLSLADRMADMHVDDNNRIFLFNGHSRLVVFEHGGDPLADSIELVHDSPNIGAVTGIETDENGTSYITSSKGLYKIGSSENRIQLVDSEMSNASCLAVQGSVLWMGTSTTGILSYDISTGEKRQYDEGSGLISSNIISLCYNEKDGELWVLSDAGVSQLDVGSDRVLNVSENVKVYPNPFSLSRINQGTSSVTFSQLAPRSVISIYAMDGSLVSKVQSQFLTDYEWKAEWTPDRSLSPGTYFAVISPLGKKVKLMLLP